MSCGMTTPTTFGGLVHFRLVNEYEEPEPVPIPLKSVSVTASLVHAVAQVEITQVFKNEEKNPIEASYIFPVDPNGAVVHFQAEVDGKVIKATAKSNKDAKKDYDEAVASKKIALMGEEIKPDVFQLKIGSLPPSAEAKVIIGYVTEVKNNPDSPAIRFVLPTTVAPRYVSRTDTGESSKILGNMTFIPTPPAPMDIKVIVNIQGDIESVESPSSHKIIVESKERVAEKPTWSKAVVTLAGNITEMDRDFVLLVTPKEAIMKPRLYYEVLPNGSMSAMTHLIPSFALKEEKVELVIVVDRSGSMGGQSIRMAGAALQLFLHSLPTDCYFNVIGFGSEYDILFPEKSRKYDQQSLQEATKYAKGLEANFGGTEILEPLDHIYSQETIPGYLRQIFVITDGEVSNTSEVIGLVKRNAHKSRLFALGIGSAASRYLVEGMASAGGGTCAFVESNDSVHKATLSQLKNALQPSLTDIKVEWIGCQAPPVELNKKKTLAGYNKPLNPENPEKPEIRQAPKNIPPIFDGAQMIVLGVFGPGQEKPTGAKITANSPDGPLTLEIKIDESNNVTGTRMLHKLAVIKIIRELEAEEIGSSLKSFEKEITELGVEHGITSKYTSFIAVDDSAQSSLLTSTGKMQFRPVPSQMNRGYPSSMVRHRISAALPMFMAETWSVSNVLCDEGAEDEEDNDMGFGLFDGGEENYGERCNRSMDRSMDTSSGTLPAVQPTKTNSQRVLAIITHQTFNGSFPLSKELCGAIGVSFEDAEAEAKPKGWDDELWGTVLAITCLTTSTGLKGEKDLWELVVKKAEKWMIQRCLDAKISVDEIKLGAAKFF